MNKLLRIFLSFVLTLVFFIQWRVHSQNVNHWELMIDASDTWKFFIAYTSPPAEWADLGFNDTDWPSGPGGIGYGEGNEGTQIPNTPAEYNTIYMRKSFEVIDKSLISWCLLFVDFDDAFVAYLNGHEIARANIGTINQKPAYNQYASNCDFEAQIPKGGIPTRFVLNPDTMAKFITTGENILAIEVHNCTDYSSDLASTTFLMAGILDDGNYYRSVPDWFVDPFTETSHLPLLVIDTWGMEIPDDPKITAWLKVVNNGVGQTNNFMQEGTDFNGFIGIEIRGQSSQMFPKKSFGFETRDASGQGISVGVLGLPEEEDWVLYAPYSDKSLLRNALTYHLGAKMGNWQPRFRFVEVYLNGNYHGIYMLIEKIKRDKNRVDINKLNPDEISGNDLTGGYILKVDKIHDLSPDEFFYTFPTNTYQNARNYAFTYEYPDYDEIVIQQKNYISQYLTDFENALNGPGFKDPVNGFRKYMDIGSFADFQIIQELANNVDGYRYSTFFYKKRDSDGGKLFAGPLWDFDLCYGNVDYAPDRLATNKWLYPNYGPNEGYCMHWWARLFEDWDYKSHVSRRWIELRNNSFKTDSILNFINQTAEYLGEAVDRNFNRWPILNTYVWPNAYIGNTYQNETDYLKNWISYRLSWLDQSFNQINGIGEIENLQSRMIIFPNPVRKNLTVNLDISLKDHVKIEIYDPKGKLVFSDWHDPLKTGINEIVIEIPELPAGSYFIRLSQRNVSLGSGKFLKL